MARSLASSPTRTAAAAVGYAAFWASLVALTAPEPRVNVVHTAASHATDGSSTWSVAHRVYDEVERRTHRLGPAQRTVVARAILEEAARAAMDPLLVLAVIHVESRFDVRATSGAGAVGLMQLLRPTMREEARRSGLGAADPFDPVANVRAGVRYLHRMVAAFDDVELALMAYNAGPNRIRRHLREGGIPERFFGYPRTVGRELARLSAAAEGQGAKQEHVAARGTPPARLVAAHAAPERDRPDGPARARAVAAVPGGGEGAPQSRSAAQAMVALVGSASHRSRGRARRARWPCGGSTARSPRSRS